MLTSKQRAFLRSMAVSIDAIYQIGKGGVSSEVTAGIDSALEARELVKVRVLETAPEDVKSIAKTVANATNADVVQVIGSKFVLYRESKDNKTIELPRIKV